MFYNEKKMTYEGEWASDLWHGNGTQVKSDGAKKIGVWKEGVL